MKATPELVRKAVKRQACIWCYERKPLPDEAFYLYIGEERVKVAFCEKCKFMKKLRGERSWCGALDAMMLDLIENLPLPPEYNHYINKAPSRWKTIKQTAKDTLQDVINKL